MSRERLLERRLRTLRAIGELVGALRSLSAQTLRAVRAELAAARAYRREVDSLLSALPEPAPGPAPGPAGLVLLAADLGLAGDYNARMARAAAELREEKGTGPVLCLGRRGAALLRRAGVEPDSVSPAPTTAASLPGSLVALVDAILDLRSRGRIGELWLVSAAFEGAGRFRPATTRVLPVEPPAGGAPVALSPYTCGPRFRAVLVREHLYAVLHQGFLEAIASEHGCRLVTAESARSWIEDEAERSRRELAAVRRELATQEVLEVLVSARALAGGQEELDR